MMNQSRLTGTSATNTRYGEMRASANTMPASVELTRKSHQATRSSLAIRLSRLPSNWEIASDTMIDDTTPQTISETMAATTK